MVEEGSAIVVTGGSGTPDLSGPRAIATLPIERRSNWCADFTLSTFDTRFSGSLHLQIPPHNSPANSLCGATYNPPPRLDRYHAVSLMRQTLSGDTTHSLPRHILDTLVNARQQP